MPNNHETLTSLFSDIADAIREKTGGTATIMADEFPIAISEIETIVSDENLEDELNTQDNLIKEITTMLNRKMPENLTEELNKQDVLISQIALALEGKCAVSGSSVLSGSFTLAEDSSTLTIPALAGRNNMIISYIGTFTSNNNGHITSLKVVNDNIYCGIAYSSTYTNIISSNIVNYNITTGEFNIQPDHNEIFMNGLYEYIIW